MVKLLKYFNLANIFGNPSSKMVGNGVTSTGSGLLHDIDVPYETATFGMGCFWGADSLFGGTIGILRTKVGFSGGTTPHPRYRSIGDHVEVVSVDFDPIRISYPKLLDLFWEHHEPRYGGVKAKRQYMSLILYHSEEQRAIAAQSIELNREKLKPRTIYTELQAAGPFYAAEDYHQKYRLQGHTELTKKLGLNGALMQTSHVAARLNGYLSGIGGLQQFLDEADSLGLNADQKEYVRRFLEQNKGPALSCH